MWLFGVLLVLAAFVLYQGGIKFMAYFMGGLGTLILISPLVRMLIN